MEYTCIHTSRFMRQNNQMIDKKYSYNRMALTSTQDPQDPFPPDTSDIQRRNKRIKHINKSKEELNNLFGIFRKHQQ